MSLHTLLEMRRLAGKFAILLSFIYVLGVVAIVIGVTQGTRTASDCLLVTVPAFAFVPATVQAIRLHRTEAPAATRLQWRWSLSLALLGGLLLVGAAALMEWMSSQ